MTVKQRGPKSLFAPKVEQGINWKFNWRDCAFGGARRKAILEHLERVKDQPHFYIMINAKHCLCLQRDPDLRRLLREKKLKMIKVPGGGKATYSALVLNEED